MRSLLIILFAGYIFSACTQTATTPVNQNSGQVPAADQKVGDTSKTGMISQSGSVFFINVMGQEPEIIESYSMELADYVGQTITVTGQYSGDTLFVGSVD
ncbi:MAG: hypothetical protein HN846_03555 [Candidatus Pacebacteria bacterium]|jgi:hypothetical protein|nr:hypothetical protein [Candidatus Paceibacterota bacterium]MBT3512106.1 hypothetical protein [Candidatus Paceibacterota bacterium]MBT4005432.1 hypothetical protein [Candidatus Paceibacterota bacterium]MBT4359141.1 hypothetical protein [Candidatus Paceibacterota bacterium]MBT4680519.1 hypothetical protein [Candidatus Paceibacterota bacterium]